MATLGSRAVGKPSSGLRATRRRTASRLAAVMRYRRKVGFLPLGARMVADLAVLVQEPTSSDPRPEPPSGIATLSVFEGVTSRGTARWLLAEANAEVSANRLLDRLRAGTQAPIRAAFTVRTLGERTSPGFCARQVTHVMPVAIPAPYDRVNEVDRWYEEEHSELLLCCPDWLRVRRYAVERIDGASWSRLALHDLASADVLSSREVRAAMTTPWRRRLAEEPWFLAEGREPLTLRS